MPAVVDLVKELTGGKEPNKGVNPDEVVAVGASPAGRRAQGRGQGRPAARRHPAVPRHRDQGRHHDQAHRAQHDDPDQALGDLHHGRGQPAVGADPGLPGRARDRGVQQEARHVRADRPAAGPARRAADRGHLRHRRQRHRARVRQGPRHRQGAVDDDHRRLGAAEGRHRADDAARPRRTPRRTSAAARRPRSATRPTSSSTRPRSSSADNADKFAEATRPRQGRGRGGARRAEEGARGHRRGRPAIKDATEKVATVSQKLGAAMYAEAQAAGGGDAAGGAGAPVPTRRPPTVPTTTSSTPRSSTRTRPEGESK